MFRITALLLALAAAAVAQSDPKYKDIHASAVDRATDLVSRMTLEEKVSQMQNTAPAIPRLGIPAYDWWNEALHGVARSGLATVFPQAIGLAATWDTDLEHRIATAISTEARAKYNDAIAHGNHGRYYGLTFWSPNINIFRDPRWGRGQETYGEDPYLTGQMASQFIEGMQGDNPQYFKTIATSKHFAVHSGPELLRHGFNAQISDEDLNDTYLYAFRQTVDQAHVDSLMCVYNAVDGVPGCASDFLLQKTLRETWKFKGYVVSDCDAVDDIYRGHHYAKTIEQADADAVKAGTDLDCGKSYDHLVDAVHQNLLSENDINRSVVRLFTARFKLGMFDPADAVPFSNIGMAAVESPGHQELALQAAREAIVLLKNDDNFLPLKAAPKRIAVVGPAADDPDAMLGNYNGIPSHIYTPLDGIDREFGKAGNVKFALGATYAEGWSARVPQSVLMPEEASKEHGLKAEYFASEDLSDKPAVTRTEPRPALNWEMEDPALIHALPSAHFSVRWSGFIRVNAGGDYKLGVIRPECHACGRVDSARVFIDDKLVISDEHKPDEQMFPKTGPVHFRAGKVYKIRVEYSQHGGGGGLQLLWTPPAAPTLNEAVKLIRNSDLTVLCVGLNSRLEGEESPLKIPGFAGGDRTDIRLPESQRMLIDAAFKTGKPVVVVLVNGSALAVPEVKQHARAILESWYGGQEAGTALAETISGKNNPAGRLPITFYASVAQLPPFTDYSMKNRTYRFFTGKPLYPFGYGLSYSQFKYTDAKIERGKDTSKLTVTVTNTSKLEGDEVAEVYLSKKEGGNPELRGFTRVHLKAGEPQPLTFTLWNSDLQDRTVAVGSGLPSKEWTGEAFVQVKVQ